MLLLTELRPPKNSSARSEECPIPAGRDGRAQSGVYEPVRCSPSQSSSRSRKMVCSLPGPTETALISTPSRSSSFST